MQRLYAGCNSGRIPMDLNDIDAQELLQPAGKAAQATVTRSLEAEDVEEAAAAGVRTESDVAPGISPVQKLRFSHHQLARLLVQGIPGTQAAATLGMHPQRVYQLQNDPTFQELLQSYEEQAEQIFQSVQERLMLTGMSALERLDDKLENEDEDLSVGELRGIMQDTFDRAGFGPQQTVNSNNHQSASQDLIEAMKENVQTKSQGRVIDREASQTGAEDAEFTDAAGSEAPASNNPGAGDSRVDDSAPGNSEPAGPED